MSKKINESGERIRIKEERKTVEEVIYKKTLSKNKRKEKL